MKWRAAGWLIQVAMAFLTSFANTASAATERYDYDGLGRLIRYINKQGLVTRYQYDAVGNILSVETGNSARPPVITSVQPTSIRRSESKDFIASGSSFLGSSVVSADPSLDISGLSVQASQLRFTVTASELAPLGQQAFTVSNAEGSTTFTLTVNPKLPEVLVSPLPIAVPPNQTPYEFVVRLSNADNISHSISLAVTDPTIAQLTTPQVTIPAGILEAKAKIAGLNGGVTSLAATANGLQTVIVPVFVTAEFAGINFAVAEDLGVVLEAPASPGQLISISPLGSPLLGIGFGPAITGIQPSSIAVGSGPIALKITGAGLGLVSAVSANSGTGLSFGAPVPAADGTSVTVPVTIASDAPTTLRQVKLDGPGAPYLASSPEADRLLVTQPGPQILSIEPLFATQGTTALAFSVRGTRLGGLQSIGFSPATGISVGSSPTVSADGTLATTTIEIAPNAPLGARLVTASTAGGTSSTEQSGANTFSVVSEIKETLTPIVSSPLGVVKEGTEPPPSSSFALYSPPLGVGYGPIAKGISPSAGSIGETVSLVISGSQLGGLTVLQMVPADGLTVGPMTVNPDGSSATTSVAIGSAAPQTVRRVRLLAGAAEIPFTSPEAAEFRVAAKLPVIQSVSPVALEIGAAQTQLTIRGLNLQGATAVGLLPANGVIIGSSPQVNGAGDELTVAIQVSGNAAPGQRIVIVTTPAGESSGAASPANTVTLVSGALGPTVTPVTAPLLGVDKQGTTQPPVGGDLGPFVSPGLGVVLQDGSVPPPPSINGLSVTPVLNLAYGAIATGVQASSFYRGASGTLTVTGNELDFINRVSLNPAAGVVLGNTVSVTPDGKQVSVPFTVASDAATGIREVTIGRNTATTPFLTPEASRLFLGVGLPQILSIEPIASARGTSFTLLIRGQNFLGASVVVVEPPEGVSVVNTPTVNANGTEATVGVVIAADAPVGARVIRLITPAGVTDGAAAPSNTFTVGQ